MPRFVDTHCHLALEPLSTDVEAVLARAREAGVGACLSIGTTLEDSRANVELARRHPMVHAAVGVHPNESEAVTDATWAALDTLAQDPSVVAIGEVGLDFYRDRASEDAQRRTLSRCLALAQRRGLPVVLHCRNAYDELLQLLRREAQAPVRGLVHCASGPAAFIRGALDLGLSISFAGNVTFPNAAALRELVPLVPDERLLIETDAPFLAPQPVRGKPNEPAYVAHTAAFLAQQRGTTVEALGALTTRNAEHLFKFPDRRR